MRRRKRNFLVFNKDTLSSKQKLDLWKECTESSHLEEIEHIVDTGYSTPSQDSLSKGMKLIQDLVLTTRVEENLQLQMVYLPSTTRKTSIPTGSLERNQK